MKKLKNKINTYSIILFTAAIIILGLTISALLLLSSHDLISTLFLIVSIGLLIFLLTLKTKLEYLKHEFSLLGLLENKQGPIRLKNKILDNDYINDLTTKLGFNHFKSNNNYSLYYKVERLSNKTRKNKTLLAVLIYKNDVSFVDEMSSNAFESLEKYLYKKEKYKERFFYQFKSTTKNFDTKQIADADKIFFLNQRQNNIVVLNILYNPINNEVYYLQANNFKPLNILVRATKELSELIKV